MRIAMLPRALAVLLLFLGGCAAPETSGETPSAAAPPPSRASESELPDPDCRSEWTRLEPGLRHRSHCEDDAAALHLVEIDLGSWSLDAVRVSPTTAPALARARNARFAINANFFDEERKTLGVIVSGETVQGPHPGSWQSIFYATAGGDAGIVLPRGWDAVRNTATMAVQAGPRIVVEGIRTNATRATPSARSGVCLRDRRVVFFVTTGMRLYDVQEIAALAARSEEDDGLGCRAAMLFDGGPSAQMHLEGSAISIDGDLVPAFVIASPRDSSS